MSFPSGRDRVGVGFYGRLGPLTDVRWPRRRYDLPLPKTLVDEGEAMGPRARIP